MTTHHHVWRPRLDRDLFLNPFAPVTQQQRNPNFERVNITDMEEGEGESSLESTVEQKQEQSPADK